MQRQSTPKTCSAEGCEQTIRSRGYCNAHYKRWQRWGTIELRPAVRAKGNQYSRRFSSVEERFWAKVDKTPECWNWTGGCNDRGYGTFANGHGHQLAHRYAYEISSGSIPDGVFVLHRCDNRRCVNPSHLWLGTAQDNTADMIAKGRAAWQGERAAHWGAMVRERHRRGGFGEPITLTGRLRHGSCRGYNSGCRCEPCWMARSDYQAVQRAKRKESQR